MKPKILIGCPTCDHYKYCTQEWIDAVKSLTYDNYDILLIDNSETDEYFLEFSKQVPMVKTRRITNLKELIARDRNLLREKAVNEGYDYFLSLEIDVIPPKDIIERLLKHNKKVVSGVYYKEYAVTMKKQGEIVRQFKKALPLVWVDHGDDKMRQLDPKEVAGDKLIESKLSGVGALLIHRDILEKVEFRVVPNTVQCDDSWFAEDIQKLGFKNYVDTGVKCRHLIKDKKISFN
jgi:GT2 family glycosyltransferase